LFLAANVLLAELVVFLLKLVVFLLDQLE